MRGSLDVLAILHLLIPNQDKYYIQIAYTHILLASEFTMVYALLDDEARARVLFISCSNIYKLKFFVCNFICVCMYECVCVRACVRVRVRVCLCVSVCASGVHWHVHAHELCESSARYPACQNAGKRIFSENFSGFDWRASFGSLENPKCTTSI